MWSFFFFSQEKRIRKVAVIANGKGKIEREEEALRFSRNPVLLPPPPPIRIFLKTDEEPLSFPSFFFLFYPNNVSLSFLAPACEITIYRSFSFFFFFFKSINLRMIRHLRAYLAKLLNAADCGFMQSGTRDVFSCSAINLCISSETDNVVTLGEYRRTVWVP